MLVLVAASRPATAEPRCPADATVGLVVDGATAWTFVRGTLRAIDLASGVPRWRLDDGSRPIAIVAPGRLLVERAGGRRVLDGTSGRELDDEAPPTRAAAVAVAVEQVKIGRHLYRLGGDCAAIHTFDASGQRAVAAPFPVAAGVVALASSGTTLVALDAGGSLILVPARGRPRPRVAAWRQVRP